MPSKKWRCDCGEVFLSDDYVPFERLPHCPKCGKKVCVTIPKCHKCEKDGLVWTGYSMGMHVHSAPMCEEHMAEFHKMRKELKKIEKNERKVES